MIPLPIVPLAAALAIVLGATHWRAYDMGKTAGAAQVQQRWDRQTADRHAQAAEAQMKARQREQALQALVNRERTKHRDEVDRIYRDHGDLIERLSHRPDRPQPAVSGAVPPASSPGPTGCTGAELYRPDAAAFARLAADADRLRADYRACKTAYSEAVKAQDSAPQ